MATIIFKPTEACNAACAYCEVDSKGWRSTKFMPHDILELLFVRISEFLMETESEYIELIWHGGEPLLLGVEYFETALRFQRKHCSAVFGRIHHRIQSNITIFSEKFVPVFREMGISVIGTSYDPVEGIRVLRKDKQSIEYNRLFMQGARLLEKNGFSWGVIYVVTKRSLDEPLDLFNYMTNLAPDASVRFNPVTVDNPAHEHLKITPDEFTEFLGAIFPVWWKYRERYRKVEPFSSLLRGIMSPEGRTFCCTDSGRCVNTHINLGPDGRWSLCGRSADWGLLDYGSLFERTISQVFSDPRRDELRLRNDFLASGECNGCSYWPVCHGGCPLDAYITTGSMMKRSNWCKSKRDFMDSYFFPISGLTPRYLSQKPATGRPCVNASIPGTEYPA